MNNEQCTMHNERLDPRVMFLFVAVLSSYAVLFREALPLVPVLLSASIAVLCAKAPVGPVLRRLRGLWATLVSVLLLQALFTRDIAHGLLMSAAALQRLVILMLGGALLARYPGHALVQAMQQLHVPYQLAYMVSVGLRFLPQFSESFRDSLAAMQLRGVEFKGMKLKTRLKIYTYLLMPTIAGGLHSARNLAMAMELRGFGAHPSRTIYAPLRMQKKDWLIFALAILLFLMLNAEFLMLNYTKIFTSFSIQH